MKAKCAHEEAGPDSHQSKAQSGGITTHLDWLGQGPQGGRPAPEQLPAAAGGVGTRVGASAVARRVSS